MDNFSGNACVKLMTTTIIHESRNRNGFDCQKKMSIKTLSDSNKKFNKSYVFIIFRWNFKFNFDAKITEVLREHNLFYLIYLVLFRFETMYAIRRYVNLKQLSKFEQSSHIKDLHIQSSVSDYIKRTFYTYSSEPSQPINRDPTFCSIEDAVKCVKSGMAIERCTWTKFRNRAIHKTWWIVRF